ncbi:MAG TPA: GNAT family N-acetyltransferase [Xanthomarina sp.]|nr:GNAT family N-acetyltransferase [Xanthomarina sp.]
MNSNPFTSQLYQDLWLKHFAREKHAYDFNFISNVKFVKHAFFPYYINVGGNSTNGITYDLHKEANDFKNKTFLVYDVPRFANINLPSCDFENLKICKVRQYKGFLANLKEFSNLEDYMASVMSSKSRNKYRSALRKFENCFSVSYKIYYKNTSKEACDVALNYFKQLIVERHEDLRIDTNIIAKWDFYRELIFPMIQKGKALLICVNVDNIPISMSLAFIEGDRMIGSVKAFNSDYYKFNIGHIELGKLIEWCFNNNIKILDFSKGEYEYKSKWTNEEYGFDCHILYDASNLKCRLTASLLAHYFSLKQYLRSKNVNLLFKKLKFQFKNSVKRNLKAEPEVSIKPLDTTIDLNELRQIDMEDKNLNFLNRTILDLLYRNPEPISNIKIYTKREKDMVNYLVVGTVNKFRIEFKPN